MISKHIGFSDSEVMRELEKQAVKKLAEDNCPINIRPYGPTGDLCSDIVTLARGLREKGFEKEAEELGRKFLLYKTAETHLYRVFDEEGEDLIDFSHKDGDIEIAPSKGGYGKVETIVSQQKKIHDIVNKKPTGKLAGGNPDGAKKSGVKKVALDPGKPPAVGKYPTPSNEPLGNDDATGVWGSLRDRKKSILNIVGKQAERTIVYGTNIDGQRKQFYIAYDSPDKKGKWDLFIEQPVGIRAELITGTPDILARPVRGLKADNREEFLKYYLKYTGTDMAFNRYGDVWKEESVSKGRKAQTGVKFNPDKFDSPFDEIFAQDNIDIANNFVRGHSKQIVDALNEVVFGNPPDWDNPTSLKQELRVLVIAHNKILEIFWKGTSSGLQLMLLAKLDGNRAGQIRSDAVVLTKILRKMTEKINVRIKHLATPSPSPDAARTRLDVWTTPSNKLKLVGVVEPRNRGNWLGMRFDQVATKAAAAKNPYWKNKVPAFKDAANLCRRYASAHPNHTLWNLLAQLGTKDPSNFKNWAHKYKTLRAVDYVLVEILPDMIKRASKKAVVKKAQIEEGPTAAAPTPQRRGRSGSYLAWVNNYAKKNPNAHKAVVSMQEYLRNFGEALRKNPKLLSDANYSADEARKAIGIVKGTGKTGLRQWASSPDGIWGTNTNASLKLVAEILGKLGVKDVELDTSSTYESNNVEARATANIGVLDEGLKKAEIDVKPEVTPEAKPKAKPDEKLWDTIQKNDFITDKYAIKNTTGISVPVGTFRTFEAFGNFITLNDLMTQTGVGGFTFKEWFNSLMWFRRRANWLKRSLYLAAVTKLYNLLNAAYVKLDKEQTDVVTAQELDAASAATPQRRDVARIPSGAVLRAPGRSDLADFPFTRNKINFITLRQTSPGFRRLEKTPLGRELLGKHQIGRQKLGYWVHEKLQQAGYRTRQERQIIPVLNALLADLNDIASWWVMMNHGSIEEDRMEREERYNLDPWSALINFSLIPGVQNQLNSRD